ncbi:MAG TPA: 6-phosphogluconolactonase [Thermoanaerobaculia bacterium]|nr:6-phosphogluconolactonase [Thermoanaerobaculia bacterium]
MTSQLPRAAPARFEVRVLPGLDSLAEEAAREFDHAVSDALRDRVVFRVALSGGSTPRSLHERLAAKPYRTRIAWERIRFFFGDERCVPPDHERSNFRMARETLFDPLRIPSAHVFRMRGEADPPAAAAEYARTLVSEFARSRSGPRFDLVFLGLGPDGHTASLFPGTKALEERARLVVANYVPKFREWRLTSTYRLLNAARRVVFLAAGEEKREPVNKILKREPGWRKLPASGIHPQRGTLLWLLDEEAGRDL